MRSSLIAYSYTFVIHTTTYSEHTGKKQLMDHMVNSTHVVLFHEYKCFLHDMYY